MNQELLTDPSASADYARVLAERLKELDCLYSISRIFDRKGANLAQVLREVTRVIPGAWQYPEVTCVRIVLNGSEYHSHADKEVESSQRAVIITSGVPAGFIEVGYWEPRPTADEGPFLIEERRLINVIGQRIGEVIEKKEAENRIHEYQEQLRSLASQLTSTEMRERRRIARELHDRIGQSLATVKIRLGVLMGWVNDPQASQILADVRQVVGQTIDDTRSLIFDISPPVLYEFGLDAALEWLSEQAQKKFGLAVSYKGTKAALELNDDLRGFLFQAASELIGNVGRHAETDAALLELQILEREVMILVEDQGKGFDVELADQRMLVDSNFGLFSIAQRLEQLGGRLDIVSSPGNGTKVTLFVPL